MQIALPQDAAHGIRRRALLVDVFNGRIELEDTAYADDDPPSVIRQRSALGIEEDKGFLGRDGTEESIKHCQLVPALLNPELIEFEVGLEFRSKIDLVSLSQQPFSFLRPPLAPSPFSPSSPSVKKPQRITHRRQYPHPGRPARAR